MFVPRRSTRRALLGDLEGSIAGSVPGLVASWAHRSLKCGLLPSTADGVAVNRAMAQPKLGECWWSGTENSSTACWDGCRVALYQAAALREPCNSGSASVLTPIQLASLSNEVWIATVLNTSTYAASSSPASRNPCASFSVIL